ncbi:alpha/beta hydrolase [Vineibacter terrae]|uniref:Alpha/beta hydrolase n=1 Tax=Vineibacter terrae TaxID=2586908 RepID=A0A5C8PR41_9HYPH|nr:alpha/beta hydrolase [Vineibacter terrae]TXL78136.1 alpha/beta hydrolase [Vineibacter terrae]
MAQFASDGVTIAYDDSGKRPSGRTVVMVHGFTSNRYESWRRVGWYDALERKGIRGVALDCRGHGESGKPHDPAAYGRAAMVRDIVALMDHLGLAQVDLMGYSMGARLALATALEHPKRIDNLVLGGVGGRLLEPSPNDGRMAAAMEADDPASIEDPLLRSFRHFADEQREDRLALAACSRGAGAPVDQAALAGLRMPVLVVVGARDGLAGSPDGLTAVIPGARSVVLPGCDHFSAIPHALFKAAVFDFLEGYLE